MLFSRSITFDEEDQVEAVSAARLQSVRSSAEIEFIDKLKAGDADAFDLLITQYSNDVFALLYRLTNDREEAADLTQETFMKVLTAVKGFRGDAGLKTWLFKIAINQSRNRYRWWKRRRRDSTISLESTVGSSDLRIHDTMADGRESPEESAISHERERLLSRTLSELPDIYREVIILCDIDGFTYEEISQMLDTNLGTIKSRIARGREELRRRLKDF